MVLSDVLGSKRVCVSLISANSEDVTALHHSGQRESDWFQSRALLGLLPLQRGGEGEKKAKEKQALALTVSALGDFAVFTS